MQQAVFIIFLPKKIKKNAAKRQKKRGEFLRLRRRKKKKKNNRESRNKKNLHWLFRPPRNTPKKCGIFAVAHKSKDERLN